MKPHMILNAIALTIILTLSGVMTASAQNAENINVDGDWQATYTTPMGAMNCHYTFKASGGLLTGKVIAEMGGTKSESEISQGKIEGDKITFSWIYNNDVEMVCTGKITGDEIQLTRQAGSYGTEKGVAKRIAASSPIRDN
jgi:hypothetical protein